jgi:hypothetical protein
MEFKQEAGGMLEAGEPCGHTIEKELEIGRGQAHECRMQAASSCEDREILKSNGNALRTPGVLLKKGHEKNFHDTAEFRGCVLGSGG